MERKPFRSTKGNKALKDELLMLLYSHLRRVPDYCDKGDLDLEIKSHLMDMLHALQIRDSLYNGMNLEEYLIGAGGWLEVRLNEVIETVEDYDLTTEIMDCAFEVMEITRQLGF